MVKKLLLATSLVAVIGGVQANGTDCVLLNGFYGMVRAGLDMRRAKHTETIPAYSIGVTTETSSSVDQTKLPDLVLNQLKGDEFLDTAAPEESFTASAVNGKSIFAVEGADEGAKARGGVEKLINGNLNKIAGFVASLLGEKATFSRVQLTDTVVENKPKVVSWGNVICKVGDKTITLLKAGSYQANANDNKATVATAFLAELNKSYSFYRESVELGEENVKKLVKLPGLLIPGKSDTAKLNYDLVASEAKVHKDSAHFGFGMGYHRSVGKFFFGGEVAIGFTPGKITVREAKLSRSVLDQYLSMTPLDTPVPSSDKISLKQNWSADITLMAGLNCGNCAVYALVAPKMTGFKVNSDILEDSKVEPQLSYKGYPIVRYELFDSYNTKVDSSKLPEPTNISRSKTKFGFELGLGIRTLISSNFFAGLRFTKQFSQKIEFNVAPAIDTNLIRRSLGSHHKFSIDGYKILLELGYQF